MSELPILGDTHVRVLFAVIGGFRSCREVALRVGVSPSTAGVKLRELADVGLISRPRGERGAVVSLVQEVPIVGSERNG